MNIFIVWGAVRDALLGVPVQYHGNILPQR
jgi:tRNA nucleotidyltransferase/poly(A) polymerase